ncbi:MAG: 3-hydroxyacyl-CoA dehydrogenase [Proteobacteria bacterium]|nr:3-hydroxyacyl-CoA dehydrogenase [Pseudomonadota bacterium]
MPRGGERRVAERRQTARGAAKVERRSVERRGGSAARTYEIKQVAVIGAGVMGAGIAAQVANAGIPVLLFDRPVEGARSRAAMSGIAAGAIEKLKKSNPAALMHPKNAALITPCNTQSDAARLKECDWIVEAVIEKLEVKHQIYHMIAKHRHGRAIVSSNTSTIPLAQLVKGQTASFKQHFVITHFFNPPRYLRLLELVSHGDVVPAAVAAIEDFCDRRLGKTVIHAKDTPGFIANRIGTYWLHAAVVHGLKMGVSVEEADAVLGKPAGIPATGVFGLLDLVGLDLMPHVLGSMLGQLPAQDMFRQLGPAPELLGQLIGAGFTGRKGKGGFYMLDAAKNKLVLDLPAMAAGGEMKHIAAKRPKVAAAGLAKGKGLRAMLEHDSLPARYAKKVLLETLLYSAQLVGTHSGSIASTLAQVDAAMRLGFNWKYGPFELIDRLGVAWFAEQVRAMGKPLPKIIEVAAGRSLYRVQDGQLCFLTTSGVYVPLKRPAGVLLLEDVKRRSKRLFGCSAASVWDIGDGVACLEFHSKMNSLNPLSLWMMGRAVRKLPKLGFKAMVIYNEGSNFSVGANILMLYLASVLRLYPFIRWILVYGQGQMQAMKYAPFPIVGAPQGMALGGGAETLLHCHALVAHAESYIGLVEVGVGIIPGWGGCKELLGRAATAPRHKGGPMPAVAQVFETVATAKVGKSAAESRDLLFLRHTDEIVMNRDRLLAAAKARALAMVPDFVPPKPFVYNLPGLSGLAALKLALKDFVNKGLATKHDVVVGTELAAALTASPRYDHTFTLTEDDVLELERASFMRLSATNGTRARVIHMLRKGKPLRN